MMKYYIIITLLTLNLPIRGPMKTAPINAAIPPVQWTMPDPAKSVKLTPTKLDKPLILELFVNICKYSFFM